jgi:hypothetical protein
MKAATVLLVLIVGLYCMYGVHAQSAPQATVTWQTLIEHEPLAKHLLTYCKVIKESQSGCADKFLAIGDNIDNIMPSIIARKAAATCMEKSKNSHVEALAAAFNVDFNALSRYASGSGGTVHPLPPPFRLDWSNDARWSAFGKKFQEEIDKRAAVTKLEQVSGIGKALQGEEDKIPDAFFFIGGRLFDIGMSLGAAHDAYDNPDSVGEKPDMVIPDPPKSSAPEIPDVPDPEPPEITPTPQSTFDPIPEVHDEPDVGGDSSDDNVETPMSDNLLRDNMQRCQDEEESKLITALGSLDPDPNAQLRDDAKDRGMEGLKLGFCDTEALSVKFCEEWKRKQIIVPLSPNLEELLKGQQTLCPGNLASESDCAKAKNEILKRYVLTSVTAATLEAAFVPGADLPYLPKINLTSTGTGLNAGVGFIGRDDAFSGTFTAERLAKLLSSSKGSGRRGAQVFDRKFSSALGAGTHDEL